MENRPFDILELFKLVEEFDMTMRIRYIPDIRGYSCTMFKGKFQIRRVFSKETNIDMIKNIIENAALELNKTYYEDLNKIIGGL